MTQTQETISISSLKQVRTAAMKAREQLRSNVLARVIGTAETIRAQRPGKGERELAELALQQELEGQRRTVEDLQRAGRDVSAAQAELEYLEGLWTPVEAAREAEAAERAGRMLSPEALDEAIREGLSGGKGLGGAMAYLKANHAGQYDGKAASERARALLAEQG